MTQPVLQTPAVVVYKVVMGPYDFVRPRLMADDHVRYVLLSDQTFWVAGGWEQPALPAEISGLSPKDASRWLKFFPQRLFPWADVSIYVDGNIGLSAPLGALARDFYAKGAALGACRHSKRKTIFEEADTWAGSERSSEGDALLLSEQLRRYRQDADWSGGVLTENSILFRNHRHPDLDYAMDLWWSEYERGLKRDQISLPWVVRQTGLPVEYFDWNVRRAETAEFSYRGWHKMPSGPVAAAINTVLDMSPRLLRLARRCKRLLLRGKAG